MHRILFLTCAAACSSGPTPEDSSRTLDEIRDVDGPSSGLDADTLDGRDSRSFLEAADNVIGAGHIARGAIEDRHIAADAGIAATKIDRRGLDADTVDGLDSDQLSGERCFEVRLDNIDRTVATAFAFDFPLDCLSAAFGGSGCTGSVHSQYGADVGARAMSSLTLSFVMDEHEQWYATGDTSRYSTATPLLHAPDSYIAGTTACTLRTTAAARRAAVGYTALSFVAGAGYHCALRVCEPSRPPVVVIGQ